MKPPSFSWRTSLDQLDSSHQDSHAAARTIPSARLAQTPMEDIIVHFNLKNPELLSLVLSPEEWQEAIDSILNNPRVKHRFVFCKWPRHHAVIDLENPGPSPHPIIKPENSLPGKMAPNGVQLWGSTLFDFFNVQQVHQRSLSTGSK